MERVTESKNNLLMNLLDNYQEIYSRPRFKVYQQMHKNHIRQFTKQAIDSNKEVAMQLNPTACTEDLHEFSGKITKTTHSAHIILYTKKGNTFHLIQPDDIHYLRLIYTTVLSLLKDQTITQ